MPDQLTECARKAAAEVFSWHNDAVCGGGMWESGFNVDGVTEIIVRDMKKLLAPYQKTIEFAANKIAWHVPPECPKDTGDMSCGADDECERDIESLAVCWTKCFANMIEEEMHKEAAP